ncbi:MAG: WbqC family protein [Bacteroidia bacterium]|nr:WbqC family protein [Bacteroidia bacterium]
MQLDISVALSDNYLESCDEDYRMLSEVKDNSIKQSNYTPKEYPQVYSHKHGFISNLSIIDLLSNQGPNAVSYL